MKSSGVAHMLRLLEAEDPKNPLTDQELAELLETSRSKVTSLRKDAGIENSRERREAILLEDIQNILEADSKISMTQLTKELVRNGYRITLNSTINFMEQKSLLASTKKATVKVVKKDAFSGIIGSQRSLSMQVEQAKAAAMYPPIGLHTLIVGETGVGKSILAEAMYKFMVNNKDSETIPFVELNCADYAENPQLLTAQLFGYKKGAFTGAESNREGLIDQANQGILFLDEVHRMPPDGQEMLFQLIDKGVYRRLGDRDLQKAQVMIIAATTEDIETSLLNTFRRRIPMVITVPPLSVRGIDEKYDIIATFFRQESIRVKREIVIKSEAIRSLLLLNYPGNIGELRSKIQVACAKGYLACMHQSDSGSQIIIDNETLVLSALPENQELSRELKHFSTKDLIVYPTDKVTVPTQPINDPYEFSEGLYRIIDTEYVKLQGNYLTEKEIDSTIWKLIEKKISRYITTIQNGRQVQHLKDNIQTIVEQDLVQMAEEMLRTAEKELGELDQTLLFCLATHFNASIRRIRNGEGIMNPNLANVKKHYPKQFKIANQMAELAPKYIGMPLPDEEIGFIAMYLSATTDAKVKIGKNIGTIVVTHGKVAAEMVAVANELMGNSHLTALCISLDESPRFIYSRLLEMVKRNNQGRGVLVLVDMGSPETFGDQIAEELGINVRTVTRVDTLMVLDAIRKTQLIEMNLDEVADSLVEQKKSVVLGKRNHSPKPEAFICFCLTGQGCARYLFEHLEEVIVEVSAKVKFVFLSLLNEQTMEEQIKETAQQYDIIGIAGSFKVQTSDIPIIMMNDIQKQSAVHRFVAQVKERQKQLKNESPQLFQPSLVFLQEPITTKKEAIQFLCGKLQAVDFVKETFIQTVKEREAMVPTILDTGVAIPHGYFSEVNQPQIAVLIPQAPIPWGSGLEAKVVLMLAFTEKTSHLFGNIYNVVADQSLVDQLTASKERNQVIECLND
ncbi:sigma 54 modulation protein [Enterococcus malodoratus]|uniref:sigma 54-interacting transcriptional regulator n=1 Tax=Enterococcus malodoratus TaxID=71451 RepID=UPI0008B5B5D3|nr:sigma 54-interacting transcriptional regulator [Enterococcus malodoratus]SET22552.1 sigma 54 modulation protein [Enterococcus malodoratus]